MNIEELVIEYQYYLESLNNTLELFQATLYLFNSFYEQEIFKGDGERQMSDNLFYMEIMLEKINEIITLSSKIDLDFTKNNVIKLKNKQFCQINDLLDDEIAWVDKDTNISDIFNNND